MTSNPWTVPREWTGERCFILGGGASLKAQIPLLSQLRGRIIAIKQTVQHRPDADVMFVSGRDDPQTCAPYFPLYTGPRIVARSNYPGLPDRVLCLHRTKAPFPDGPRPRWLKVSSCAPYSRRPTHLGGYDAGSSAINLAALFGATEIVLLGIDMTGGRWVPKHRLPVIPQWHFDAHLWSLAQMAPELAKDGIRVVNCSPISAVRCFERQPLEAFL